MIHIQEFTWQSEEYWQLVELRDRILRKPLGLKLTAEDIANERTRDSKEIHLGAFKNEKPVGCLILSPLSDLEVRMRQVAIDSDHQRQGIGKKLVEHFEQIAKRMGFHEVQLSARNMALPFYLALGYRVQGEPFIAVGVVHSKMIKEL